MLRQPDDLCRRVRRIKRLGKAHRSGSHFGIVQGRGWRRSPRLTFTPLHEIVNQTDAMAHDNEPHLVRAFGIKRGESQFRYLRRAQVHPDLTSRMANE
jgi:hypothetical protein